MLCQVLVIYSYDIYYPLLETSYPFPLFVIPEPDKISNKIRYITYYDLDQQGYRCAVGKVWITSEVA